MQDYIIAESYTLPSKGLVYDSNVNPEIKIRSMTTNEEIKRLGKTDLPYKMISEIIDDCLVEKPGISAYDMCIADYQFLFHKLRVVTYGSDYKIETVCPVCGATSEKIINLEDLEVSEYSDAMKKYLHFTLPVSKKVIDIRLQTPRMLDEIQLKAKETLKKASKFKGEPAFLYTLESLISKVDGQVLDEVKLEQFVRALPMRDVNYILKNAQKVDFGIKSDIDCTCPTCGGEYNMIFPITSEFFGPSID